jgi:hypothetical protein
MTFLQLHGSVLLAVAIISPWAADRFTIPIWLAFLVMLGVAEVATHCLLQLGLWRISREKREFQKVVTGLSFSEARERALAALNRGSFRVVVSLKGKSVDFLPESASEIFERFESIQTDNGDLLRVGQSSMGYVDLGRSFDGATFYLRLSDGSLFEAENGKVPSAQAVPDYPSIYHWLSLNCE